MVDAAKRHRSETRDVYIWIKEFWQRCSFSACLSTDAKLKKTLELKSVALSSAGVVEAEWIHSVMKKAVQNLVPQLASKLLKRKASDDTDGELFSPPAKRNLEEARNILAQRKALPMAAARPR